MRETDKMNEFYISFNSEIQTINGFLVKSKISLKSGFVNSFITLLSSLCFLKEEEKKLNPKILFGHNISGTDFAKITPEFVKIVFYRCDYYNDINLYAKIKPLLPFCNKNWFVYVNIDKSNDTIEFGIMKSYLSFESISMDELLFSNQSGMSLCDQYGISCLQIMKKDSRNIELSSSNGLKCEISFSFDKKVKCNGKSDRDDFVDDIIGSYRNNHVIKRSIENLIDSFIVKLHGTICLVVNRDSDVNLLGLADGIYFEEPIDLMAPLVAVSKIETEIKSGIKVLLQRVYDTYDLLYEMLDFDGITIITDDFKILGYNAFIKSETLARDYIAGGARRRAAETLLSNGNANYVGVYFQSQDGEYFYKRSRKE